MLTVLVKYGVLIILLMRYRRNRNDCYKVIITCEVCSDSVTVYTEFSVSLSALRVTWSGKMVLKFGLES